MKKNEYIIINKTAIQKRIEEWENKYGNEDIESSSEAFILMKEFLSQSTPLIPEIEKGIKQGLSICLNKKDWAYGISGSAKQDTQDYITNLKLDI